MKNSQSSFASSFMALIAAGLSLTACTVDSSDEMLDEEQDSIAEEGQELIGGPWTWVNGATGRCLDSNSAGSAYALGCNGGNFQHWTHKQYGIVDEIRNLATGRCLDSDFNGKVYTLSCNGGNYQRWTVAWKGTDFEIRNVATGRCLDSNGNGKVYTLACNGGNYQRWD